MLLGAIGEAALPGTLLLTASLFLPIPLWKGIGIMAAGSVVSGLVLGLRAQPHIKALAEPDRS